MVKKHLILLHGFLENHRMWDDMLRLISKKDFIIHTPHLPGHHSDVPLLGSHATSDYCAALLKQVDVQPHDEVFIIGHSMGGYLASHLVFAIPGKIKGLCLFQSKCKTDDPEKIEQRKRAIEAAHKDLSLYVQTMIGNQFSEASKTSLRAKIEAQMVFAKSLSAAVIQECQELMIHRPDGLPRMLDRSFPLYYFLGQNDPSVVLASTLEEANQLPGALVHVEEGIGHMGHWEATRSAAAFINRILFAAFDEQDRG